MSLDLYEMCLNVISCKFKFINMKYIKDLPKHILEQVLQRLNPYDLETIENEEFLNLRGISSDSLWKAHFTRHFKHGAKLPALNCNCFTLKPWRTQYFERHFHELIHKIALKKSYQPEEDVRQTQDTEISHVSLPDINNILDICINHLTGIRVSHNTTCIYLAQSPDLLMKLSLVLEKVEIGQLQDRSVGALIQILDIFLPNKLKSFSLSNCKVEHTKSLKTLLKALAKFQSLETHGKLFDNNDPTIVNDCSTFNEKCAVTLESSCSISDNQQSYSNRCEMNGNEAKRDFYYGTDKTNDNLCNDWGNEERNCGSSVFELNKTRATQDQKNHTPGNTCQSTEDDLFEDVFLRQASLPDTCHESHTVNAMSSSSLTRTPIENLRKHDMIFNQLRPNCLTELKLSSCLMDNKNLTVFSEELVHFLGLLSLELCDVGLCSFAAMNGVLTSVNKLVILGSLRYLVFENESLTSLLMEMFCDMLILSCEKCRSTKTHKGLWSLRLVGGFNLNIGCFGKVLGTCSFCEERVFARDKNSGIRLKMKDNKLHSSHLKKDVVLPFCESSLPVPHSQKNEQEKPPSSKRRYITSGIESLYFSIQDINAASWKILASSISRNRSLRNISLPSCGLKTEDISYIFDCIAGDDSVEVNTVVGKLELRNNLFDINQNNSLCNLISRSHLVYLDLSYCSLEVIPEAVVVSLSSNKILQVLMLAGNRLGDAGVIQLSNVFMSAIKTSVLHTLDLSCNRLTTCSLLHLGNVLSTEWPTKLREISIRENPMVNFTTVKECLNRVFDVVIMEPVVDGVMAYVDYLSEM